jgi:hypothetical protein
MPIAEFEGKRYDFPEGTSQEEMIQALNGLPKEEKQLLAEDKQEPFAEEAVIKKDEGVRRNKEGSHVSYRDSKKLPTGGRGHLLTEDEIKQYPTDTAIPDTVVGQWFQTDMKEADQLLTGILEEKAVHVPDEVYSILLNMTFNLGEEGIEEFEDMWAAVEVGDWQEASKQMLLNAKGTGKSDWLKQVGNRAIRLANRMAAVQSNIQENKAAATE